MTVLSEPAIARHVKARIRSAHRQDGWRVFLSDRGRWWATTTTLPVAMPETYWQPRHTVMGKDAIDADTYTELAAKLRKRSNGGI